MSVIHFETNRDGNLIRIPDQYMDKISNRIAVTLIDVEKSILYEYDKAVIRDIEAASMSSMGFWDNQDDEVWDNV